MADFWSGWDSRGRYTLHLNVVETSVNTGANSSSGTWQLRLVGQGTWTFYDWTTTGSVTINGSVVHSWNAKRPASAWTAASGTVLASGTWTAPHNPDGTKVMAVSAMFNGTGVDSAYGPGSILNSSGNVTLTPINVGPSVPGKVSNPTFYSVTSNSATIFWDAPTSDAPILNYDLNVCDSASGSAGNCSVFYGSTGQTWTFQSVSGLQSSKTYYVRVRARNSAGYGTWSNWRSFTTLAPSTPPSQMAAPTFSAVTATEATVNWTAPASDSAINNYDLNVCDSASASAGNCTVHYGWTGSTATSKALTGLKRNTTYHVRIAANNSGGRGPFSSWSTFKTSQFSAPSAPTGYGATDVTPTTAYTSMPAVADNGGGDLSDIRIQLNTSASETGATTLTANGYQPIFIQGRTPDTQYYYRMAVKNEVTGGGWSAYGSWVEFKTVTNRPSHVGLFSAVEVDDVKVRLAWDSPVDLNGSTVTGYQLRLALNDSFSSGLKMESTGASSDEHEFTGLNPGTRYYAQIWPLSAAGAGGYSDIITFVTQTEALAQDWIHNDGQFRAGKWWTRHNGQWYLSDFWENVEGVWHS